MRASLMKYPPSTICREHPRHYRQYGRRPNELVRVHAAKQRYLVERHFGADESAAASPGAKLKAPAHERHPLLHPEEAQAPLLRGEHRLHVEPVAVVTDRRHGARALLTQPDLDVLGVCVAGHVRKR